MKKTTLKNFAIFTGKERCWSLLIALQGFRSAILLKKETPTQVLPCEYCKKTFKTPILKNISKRLLPNSVDSNNNELKKHCWVWDQQAILLDKGNASLFSMPCLIKSNNKPCGLFNRSFTNIGKGLSHLFAD